MAYIYEYIKHLYPNTINEGIFYDLGSGTGKAVFQGLYGKLLGGQQRLFPDEQGKGVYGRGPGVLCD